MGISVGVTGRVPFEMLAPSEIWRKFMRRRHQNDDDAPESGVGDNIVDVYCNQEFMFSARSLSSRKKVGQTVPQGLRLQHLPGFGSPVPDGMGKGFLGLWMPFVEVIWLPWLNAI